ncbi:MAG: polysaccharide biosynthesis tyrosine autokinase [Clostridiales bacterium]|nr:polysaccharide biosynthesis tyrosine autokinase [Clostridiales bacterium]
MQNIVLKSEELDYRTKEAFKTLRTNIDLSGDSVKVICLTSCMPNEGKSSVAFNLATAYAQDGKKTLLIDADLRKSVMKFKVQEGLVKTGLTNFLAGKATLDEAICATDIERLYTIFAGPVPPNPSELLGNSRFSKLIEIARETFDMVIIDTPPLGSVIDTAVIAKNCDGAALVIAQKQISRRFIVRVKSQLETTGCRILGCILNKVDLSDNAYYGKYYGKYYGNYGNEETER